MVTSLLSASGARDVEAAVTRVEQSTSAQLVVAVLPRSADHWQGRMLVSLAWALAAGLAGLRFFPGISAIFAVLAETCAGALGFFLLGLPSLHRLLVAPAAAERAAHARAFQLFAQHGLYGTKRRTALLIFVSELERRVVLLGDAPIHAHLGEVGWQTEVQRLITSIRAGRLREGLLEVIAQLEPRLAAVAPHHADDTNELPDSVLRA
jgi:putative membrane protein